MRKIISILLALSMLVALAGCFPRAIQTMSEDSRGEDSSSNSRSNPAKAGKTLIYNSMKESYDAFELEITLVEVLRGGAALRLIKQADNYNDPPPAGKEYFMAKFKIKALRSKNDEEINPQYMFNIVRKDGSTYDDLGTYVSGVKLLSAMYEGATQEGYVVFLVDEDDNDLLIVFPEYGGRSRLWFSGKPTDGRDDDYSLLGDPNRLGSRDNPAKLNETANYNGVDLSYRTYEFTPSFDR